MRVFVVAFVAWLATACAASENVLRPQQELPDDVAALVDTSWDRFADAFAGRLECIEPVELVLVRDVPDGDAIYRREAGRIEIEIPTSPSRFPESLVHELAHHVEATCPEHEQLRASFLAAQGLLGAESWFEGETWEQVPSEHFAEAVVQVVNGRRILHDDVIELSPEAIQVVTHWGRNGS